MNPYHSVGLEWKHIDENNNVVASFLSESTFVEHDVRDSMGELQVFTPTRNEAWLNKSLTFHYTQHRKDFDITNKVSGLLLHRCTVLCKCFRQV